MHWLLTGPLTVETVTVAIADLPDHLKGLRLVQLSDFHYDGLRLSEDMLSQAIDATNQVNPDLILLTGDYVTDDPDPIHKLALRLQKFNSRYGIYAVLGNHDNLRKAYRREIVQAMTSAGIQVLWNEIAYPLGEGFPVVGLADFWSSHFDPDLVMNQLSPETPRLVLSHNPDSAEVLRQWRVDLQLSGHTHGGQIVIPGLGNASRLYESVHGSIPRRIRRKIPFIRKHRKVVYNWEWSQGLHQVGSNQLYINRGLGTYPPGRLFCPPEVTVITLQPQGNSPKARDLAIEQPVHLG